MLLIYCIAYTFTALWRWQQFIQYCWDPLMLIAEMEVIKIFLNSIPNIFTSAPQPIKSNVKNITMLIQNKKSCIYIIQIFKSYSDMNQKQIPILLFFLISVALGSLQVYMPKCASDQLTNSINYTLANFGHIPYGRTIIGELIIPNNTEFCNYDQTDNFGNLKSQDVRKFVIIKRGGCKFTKKILNAQKRGADMVIVYDYQSGIDPSVVMSNDGHGHLIEIPSIFISSLDGDKLRKVFQKCGKSTILKIKFEVFTSRVANLTFWLDANNRESYITIKDFYHDYYNVLQKYLNIDLKFKIHLNCGSEKCQADDCIKNKQQYCLHTNKFVNGVPVPGKELVAEHLRSYYLFAASKAKSKVRNWFDYMVKFDQSVCTEKLDIRDCSLGILKNFETVQSIEAKVSETYKSVNEGKENILDKFVNDAYNSDILFYPQASINGRNYYGLFRAPDIFQMICESLEKPPKQCHSFTKTDGKQIFGNDPSTGLWKTILLIIVFAILLFFAALFIYNRLIRRQMNQQMSMQVNKMVEHYVAMTEQKSRSNAAM